MKTEKVMKQKRTTQMCSWFFLNQLFN